MSHQKHTSLDLHLGGKEVLTASGAPLRKESADGNLGVSSPRGRQVPFAPTSRTEFFRRLLEMGAGVAGPRRLALLAGAPIPQKLPGINPQLVPIIEMKLD